MTLDVIFKLDKMSCVIYTKQLQLNLYLKLSLITHFQI